ncbi:MAG: RluA family pseudouridine synthase [Pseudobdellovibrionaceae bacterium]
MSSTYSSVLFENENFIAVDKKSGVLSVPSRMGKQDPRPVLGLELQEDLKKQIYPVHRLDFEVSGIVIFALNSSAHKWANTAFESRQVHKTYHALSEKKSAQEFSAFKNSQNWQSLLVRGKKRAFEAPYGQEALTVAKILGENEKSWLWQLNPLTGRSHQLRVEMAKQGFPILGDTLYGSKIAYDLSSIALRAVVVDFKQLTDFKKWSLPEHLETSSFLA